MQAGDIVGWSGRNFTSAFINLATWGLPLVSISHVGIMAEYRGRLLHFESTTLSDLPCAIQGRQVKGTQAVDLADRLKTYRGRAYHFPLYRSLYPHESRRLTQWLVSRIGLEYDAKEAVESGGLFGILAEGAHRWRIVRGLRGKPRSYFCSEEDAGAISAIGLWPTDDAAKWNPNKLVRHYRRNDILLPRRRLK